MQDPTPLKIGVYEREELIMSYVRRMIEIHDTMKDIVLAADGLMDAMVRGTELQRENHEILEKLRPLVGE